MLFSLWIQHSSQQADHLWTLSQACTCTAYSQHSQKYVLHSVVSAPAATSTSWTACKCTSAARHQLVTSCLHLQDSSELWNHDAIQTSELFQQLRLGKVNCLADNRHVSASHLTCHYCANKLVASDEAETLQFILHYSSSCIIFCLSQHHCSTRLPCMLATWREMHGLKAGPSALTALERLCSSTDSMYLNIAGCTCFMKACKLPDSLDHAHGLCRWTFALLPLHCHDLLL